MLRNVLRIVAIILVTGLLAVALEVFYFNRHAMKAENATIQIVPEDLVASAKGFSLQDGGLVADQDQAIVRINQIDRYVHQVIMTYSAETDDNYYLRVYPIQAEASVGTTETDQDEENHINLDDRYQASLHQSATRVDQLTGDLMVIVPDAGLRINSIEIDSRFALNWPRLFFIWISAALILTLLLAIQLFSGHVEYLFVSIGLLLGLLLIGLSPTQPVGWDEQIHFRNIYFNSFSHEVRLTPAADRYANMLVPQSDSLYEQQLIRTWLDNQHHEDQAQILPATSPWRLSQAPYAIYSLAFWLARLFGLSFSATILAAKLGGLAMYLAVTALAIRIIPFGKHLLAVYALMPTLLFQATRLTYDTLTIAASFLVFAVIIAELTASEKVLPLRRFLIFAVAAILMTSFKTVYLPLVVLAYLLPESKFTTGKMRLLYLFAVSLLIVGMALNFILPTLNGSLLSGDVRVEGTSVAGQLSFIYNQPLAFLTMLWTGITSTMGNYFLAYTAILSYSYAWSIESSNLSFIATLLLFFLAVTDRVAILGRQRLLVAKRSKVAGRFSIAQGSKITVVCLKFTGRSRPGKNLRSPR